MHLRFRGLLLMLLVMIGVSCEKNSDIFIEYYPIENYLTEVQTDEQSAQFDPKEDFTLHGIDGLKIVFPKGSLVNNNGELPQGVVTIHYKLLTGISDYINNKISTEGVSTFIDAHHIVSLSIDNDQGRLFPNSSADQPIQLFVPNEKPVNNIALHNLTDAGWQIDNENDVAATDYMGRLDGEDTLLKGYVLELTEFDWLCLGRPIMNADVKYDVCVSLPENYNDINSLVYLTIDNIGTVVNLAYNSEKLLFCGEINGVPEGSDINIIAISDQEDNGNFNFAVKSSDNINGTITIDKLEAKTIKEIERLLDSI